MLENKVSTDYGRECQDLSLSSNVLQAHYTSWQGIILKERQVLCTPSYVERLYQGGTQNCSVRDVWERKGELTVVYPVAERNCSYPSPNTYCWLPHPQLLQNLSFSGMWIPVSERTSMQQLRGTWTGNVHWSLQWWIPPLFWTVGEAPPRALRDSSCRCFSGRYDLNPYDWSGWV